MPVREAEHPASDTFYRTSAHVLETAWTLADLAWLEARLESGFYEAGRATPHWTLADHNLTTVTDN
jgi:hypothetical protein